MRAGCYLVLVACTSQPVAPIEPTANSITITDGPGRSDPEGVAPLSPQVSVVTWHDSRDAMRAMQLYGYLYQYDLAFDDGADTSTIRASDDAFGHPGFGFVVSHTSESGNSPLGKADDPTVTDTIFAGAHHAIHHVDLVYDRDKEAGGMGVKIPVAIDWFVATGRDHPVWAVTWKMSGVDNPQAVDFDTYRMDARGPYGSLEFDGAATKEAGDAIGGVGWGDAGFRFATTDAQLTLDSPWTYNTPNQVAFSQAWTATANTELGIVQTRAGDATMGYPDRVLGRERGVTSADAYTDKDDCTGFGDARAYSVPCVGGWPYQLMSFDWDPASGKPASEATGTKLVAWGTPFGFLGASSYDTFGGTADGRGDRSYATFVVVGPKCRFDDHSICQASLGEVSTTISDVEALAAATVTDATFDDRFAVWETAARDLTLSPVTPVKTPILRVTNWDGGLPSVTIDGVHQTVNTGFADSAVFASVDADKHELWLTLNLLASNAIHIHIDQ